MIDKDPIRCDYTEYSQEPCGKDASWLGFDQHGKRIATFCDSHYLGFYDDIAGVVSWHSTTKLRMTPLTYVALHLYEVAGRGSKKLWSIAVCSSLWLIKKAPPCGAAHGGYNKCCLPVGHPGDHHDGDLYYWK